MGIGERIIDSFNALVFKKAPVSVHTRDGAVGYVTGVKILGGEITIKLNDDGIRSFRGRDVADLDTGFFQKVVNERR